MQYAIETEKLSKSYGHVRAVTSLNLRVRPGEIYGFLGLNGAGKTTTIRLVLGMVRPTNGTVRVLGQPIGAGGRGPWGRVGHMVEYPAAYPQLSVYENLEIARRLQGVADASATQRILAQLELQAYADRKAAQLSTGNLQRLGLARALLHQPELLILDEPANGLDPAGVAEIRQMLNSLAHDHGVAIFMSSHILPEVDRLATRLGIIHKGRLIEELDADRLEALRRRRLEIQARDLQAARSALLAANLQVNLAQGTILLDESRAVEHPDQVAAILCAANVPPTRLAVTQEDLESHFLRLTAETA
ncbi:MAG: ABC transporter ATP-binding protein [Anaerolineales bacterium]